MTNINPRNFAQATGVLARAPKFFPPNANNSQSVRLTLGYTEETVRDGETTKRWRNVSFEGYVPPAADGSVRTVNQYSGLVKGSNVLVNYEPHDDSYQKDGKTVYTQVNTVLGITFLDSAERAKELRAKAAAEEAAASEPAPAAEPVAQAPVAADAVDPFA